MQYKYIVSMDLILCQLIVKIITGKRMVLGEAIRKRINEFVKDKKSLTATFPSETLLTMLQGSSVPREKEKDDKM